MTEEAMVSLRGHAVAEAISSYCAVWTSTTRLLSWSGLSG